MERRTAVAAAVRSCGASLLTQGEEERAGEGAEGEKERGEGDKEKR